MFVTGSLTQGHFGKKPADLLSHSAWPWKPSGEWFLKAGITEFMLGLQELRQHPSGSHSAWIELMSTKTGLRGCVETLRSDINSASPERQEGTAAQSSWKLTESTDSPSQGTRFWENSRDSGGQSSLALVAVHGVESQAITERRNNRVIPGQDGVDRRGPEGKVAFELRPELQLYGENKLF